MKVKWDKKEGGLALDSGGTIDTAMFNLIRRILMRDYLCPVFTEVSVTQVGIGIPTDMIRNRIMNLPVTQVGEYTLDLTEGDIDVMSELLHGPGEVERGILLTRLPAGGNIKVHATCELRCGQENLKSINFLFRHGNKCEYVIEPLSDLLGERDCRKALKFCLTKIKGWSEEMSRAMKF